MDFKDLSGKIKCKIVINVYIDGTLKYATLNILGQRKYIIKINSTCFYFYLSGYWKIESYGAAQNAL